MPLGEEVGVEGRARAGSSVLGLFSLCCRGGFSRILICSPGDNPLGLWSPVMVR